MIKHTNHSQVCPGLPWFIEQNHDGGKILILSVQKCSFILILEFSHRCFPILIQTFENITFITSNFKLQILENHCF